MSDILTQPSPQTDADYEAAVHQLLAEMNLIEEKIDRNRAENECLKTETQVIKAETEIIKARTAAAHSDKSEVADVEATDRFRQQTDLPDAESAETGGRQYCHPTGVEGSSSRH